MRIGSRWRAGTPAPAGLPPAFVSHLEDAAVPEGFWTLTWLEGRPVAEHENGTRIVVRADGSIGPDADDDDDDWLS